MTDARLLDVEIIMIPVLGVEKTSRGGRVMAVERVRRTATRKEADVVMDDYMSMGYKIKNEGDSVILLRKRTFGNVIWHIVIAFFIGWWLLFVPNLAYALIAYYAGGDQVMIKIGDVTEQKEG